MYNNFQLFQGVLFMNKDSLAFGKEPSKIRESFEYCKKKRKENPNIEFYDFSIGNPSVPSPKEVNETIKKLMDELSSTDLHGYTSGAGDQFVRDEIARYINKTYNASIKGEYIYMTCGAAAAISISFSALLDDNDEAIVFAPFFPEYRAFIAPSKGKLITINSDSSLLPDYDALEKAINRNTRILLINSPNNPTGVFYDEEVIKKLSEILLRKEKEYGKPIYLVSDEPYRELLYEGEKYPFITNYYHNSIVCYSFSKCLSMPGERIGYILVNPKADDVEDIFCAICGSGRSLGYVCAPSMFQKMIPSVLGLVSDISIYKRNRDKLYKSLSEIGYEVINPQGAFYMFVKALEEDANHFVEVTREYNIIVVPSDTFGIKGYFRIAYCVSEEVVDKSIPAFKKLFERYKK